MTLIQTPAHNSTFQSLVYLISHTSANLKQKEHKLPLTSLMKGVQFSQLTCQFIKWFPNCNLTNCEMFQSTKHQKVHSNCQFLCILPLCLSTLTE
jgi:hypothetical protein